MLANVSPDGETSGATRFRVNPAFVGIRVPIDDGSGGPTYVNPLPTQGGHIPGNTSVPPTTPGATQGPTPGHTIPNPSSQNPVPPAPPNDSNPTPTTTTPGTTGNPSDSTDPVLNAILQALMAGQGAGAGGVGLSPGVQGGTISGSSGSPVMGIVIVAILGIVGYYLWTKYKGKLKKHEGA